MINNQKLNTNIVKILSNLPYEMKVNTFDTNCKDCPFANYTVITDTHFTHTTRRINCKDNFEEARHIAWSEDGRIERSCIYGGGSYTLKEVVMNTCKLWDNHLIESEAEDAEFITVDNIEELCVQIPQLKI